MKRTKKAVAVAIAATMCCGLFAGCDLVTKDTQKDFAQVIAKVNITDNEDFSKYQSVIQTSEILKRDMVAAYISSGYSLQNTYGWTYEDTFKFIGEQLVNRQLFVQYAITYYLDSEDYTLEGYNQAVAANPDDELAGIKYFLSEDEEKRALYNTRVLFNNTLDSQEKQVIEERKLNKEEEETSEVTVRTLPTGVNTKNDEYYNEDYRIYTGYNTVSECHGYETVEGSTSTTRNEAYRDFLSGLRSNGLLTKAEDVSNVEALGYFEIELRSAYENMLVTKLGEAFESEAEEKLDADYMNRYYNDVYNQQKVSFAKDKSSFESAMDNLSDSNFLLTAPSADYGYVINILLPFSSAQSAVVSALSPDQNDPKGNSFIQRAQILKNIQATDQRASWFLGEEDYSYETEEGYTGGNVTRNRLFFEDCIGVDDKAEYQALKNYYGQYTYNGAVVFDEAKDKYVYSPNRIGIDEFITEMNGYLQHSGLTVSGNYAFGNKDDYYAQSDYYKTEDGVRTVDYSKFVYYEGKVDLGAFDANNLFVQSSTENKAMSVIKELSFAYNTDTAGLNGYLGYKVIVDKTDFVSEFEYAAQLACKGGAGTIVIAPSQYGWHVIYCTFSFQEENGEIKPFDYNHADALDEAKEGCFSDLFYEAVKTSVVQNYSNNRQQEIINQYNESSSEIFENRYKDLYQLGT